MSGRISSDSYVLTEEQIETFHRDGLVTLHDVLTEEEVVEIEVVFDKFLNREIHVPGKDFCDMSKPFGIPFEEWSIVNCMLPTRYHPPFQNNIFERLTADIVRQIHPKLEMSKDYDQLLNKRPGKADAVFAWHQDMGYWPNPKALGVDETATCTFSLAIDDSTEENGCLRYIPGSGLSRTLRKHAPLASSRDEGHALTIEVDESKGDVVKLAPCKRGCVTIHDEFVVVRNMQFACDQEYYLNLSNCLLLLLQHGSSGNKCPDRQRRTYVLAYRPKTVVEAERKLGFTHSHNDEVNWDTFDDGEK